MYTSEINSLLAKAQSLAREFSQSALYQEYKACQTALEKDPMLWNRVMEYKNAQTAFEYKRLQNTEASFDEEKHVANLYTELTLNSGAAKFLACERALLRLYREVFDLLCEACEVGVGG